MSQIQLELIAQIEDLLDDLKLTVVIPPASVVLTTEAQLDAALAEAAPGAVLTLSASLVYTKPLTLRKSVTLAAELLPEGRMTREPRLPRFTAGLTVPGSDVTLRGLEVRHTNPLTEITSVTGANVTFDRLRLLGDAIKGARRGVAGNGINLAIVRCYMDDCFQSYPGNDSQAILVWNTPGPVLIEDNFLSAGSETIMLGGADPSSEANVPNHVTIRGNTITANPEWQTKAIGIKTRLEIKNGKNVLIEGNEISQCWGGKGQDGYLLTLTVRNQDGRAPYSTIEHVVIRNNQFSQGAAAINILGVDNLQPSQRVTDVQIVDNTFTDINARQYTGSLKLMLVGRGPLDTTIARNEFVGSGHTSVLYFHSGTPKCENFSVTDNVWPKTKYGIFGDNTSVGGAWNQYVASGELARNVTVAPVPPPTPTPAARSVQVVIAGIVLVGFVAALAVAMGWC